MKGSLDCCLWRMVRKTTIAKRFGIMWQKILKHYFATFTFVFSLWLEMDRPVAKFCSPVVCHTLTGRSTALADTKWFYRNTDISKSPKLRFIEIWLYTSATLVHFEQIMTYHIKQATPTAFLSAEVSTEHTNLFKMFEKQWSVYYSRRKLKPGMR